MRKYIYIYMYVYIYVYVILILYTADNPTPLKLYVPILVYHSILIQGASNIEGGARALTVGRRGINLKKIREDLTSEVPKLRCVRFRFNRVFRV